MDEKIERIKGWMEGKRKGPYTLELNPTNRCNLKCRFCWQRGVNPDYSEELSDEKLLKIIDEATEIGIKEIRIPGSGEPMIRKEVVVEMMEKIKENSIYGLLITNGTFLDEDSLEKMLKAGWDNLTVSLDGSNARTHDFLRGRKGTFKVVLESLKKLNELKAEYGSKKPKLRFNTVLTNKNYKELPQLIELAKGLNCEDVQLQPMTPFSELGEQCQYKGSEKELNKYLEKANILAKKYDIHTNMSSFVSNSIVQRTDEMDKVAEQETEKIDNRFVSALCFEPWYNMVILPNGKTAQCSMFGGKGGAQIKGKSLKQVWYGDYFEKARERMLNHDQFSYCENCCVPVNLENKRIRKKLKDRLI